MIGLIWVIALIAAIPTYGISIIIAAFLSCIIINKEKSRNADLWKSSIINKYYNFRSEQELPTTKLSDNEIIGYVVKYISVINNFLEKNSLENTNKEAISLLAIRLASYEEEVEPEELKKFVDNDLNMIFGYQVTDSEGNCIEEDKGIMCAYKSQYEPSWRHHDKLESMEADRLINRATRLLEELRKI